MVAQLGSGISSGKTERIDGDAERALIGACLSGGRGAVEAALEAGSSAGDFAVQAMAAIWRSMVRLTDAERAVDALQVVEDLLAHGQLDAVGGAAAVAQAHAWQVTPDHMEDRARLVIEHAAFRRLTAATQEIGMLAASRALTAVELVALAQGTFGALNEHIGRAAEVVDRRATVREVVESAGKPTPGAVPTGIGPLDDLLDGGLRPGTLTLIAGRPGQGKTALALAIAGNIADLGIPVGFFELEMPARALISREISSVAGIAKRDWHINRDNMARVSAAAAVVDERPLHIIDRPGLTVAEICAAARRLKARMGIGCVFVDHIGKVKASDRYAGDRNNETGEVSEALRALSGTLDMPVVALSQLNRKVEDRADKRAGLADLRDSGTLEQDAHAVIMPYRPEYYLRERTAAKDVGLCELDLVKNRDGAGGTVRVRFDATTQRFSEWADNV